MLIQEKKMGTLVLHKIMYIHNKNSLNELRAGWAEGVNLLNRIISRLGVTHAWLLRICSWLLQYKQCQAFISIYRNKHFQIIY